MISFYFVAHLEESTEDTVPEAEGKTISLREILSRSKIILKENKDFKNFLIADALILMSLTASAFYAVYAVRKFNLPTSYAALYYFNASMVWARCLRL
jgi:hypothetical protein